MASSIFLEKRVNTKQGKMKMKLGSVKGKGGVAKLKKSYLPKNKKLEAKARIAAASDSSDDSDVGATATNATLDKEMEDVHDLDDKEKKEFDNSSEDGEGGSGNPSWADAMSKLLNTRSVAGKPIVMAKGQTDQQIAAKLDQKPEEFQVLNADGTVAEPSAAQRSKCLQSLAEMTFKEAKKKRELKKLMKKDWEESSRKKLDITKKDRERQYRRIMSKGMVQLYTSVQRQQSTITQQFHKVGKSEVKREKVMKSMTKGKFLDSLNSKIKSVPLSVTPVKSKKTIQKSVDDEDKPTWKILREDYMMGATMKDWDKQSDSDEDK